MNLIVCVDNNGCASFFGKRVSKDRMVEEDIKAEIRGSNLYAHPYSESFFLDPSPNIHFETDYVSAASDSDYIFYEIGDIDQSAFDTIYLYCWNRNYPQDKIFKPGKSFKLINKTDFKGYSHEKITKKIYKK